MEVIGYRKSEFDTSDGKHISGFNIYCSYPLEKGHGDGCDRLFVTDEKLAQSGYIPSVGDTINVLYNKYGKPAGIQLM